MFECSSGQVSFKSALTTSSNNLGNAVLTAKCRGVHCYIYHAVARVFQRPPPPLFFSKIVLPASSVVPVWM